MADDGVRNKLVYAWYAIEVAAGSATTVATALGSAQARTLGAGNAVPVVGTGLVEVPFRKANIAAIVGP